MNKPGLGLLERQHQLCRSLALINPRRPSVQVAELGSIETPGKPIQRNPHLHDERGHHDTEHLSHHAILAAPMQTRRSFAGRLGVRVLEPAARRAGSRKKLRKFQNPRGRIQRSRALNHDGRLAARYCFASTWASIRVIKASAGAALRASFSGLASHRMLE